MSDPAKEETTCPACNGRLARTPVYHDGRTVYRCEDCAALVVDDAQEPVSPGKLIPLRGVSGG